MASHCQIGKWAIEESWIYGFTILFPVRKSHLATGILFRPHCIYGIQCGEYQRTYMRMYVVTCIEL